MVSLQCESSCAESEHPCSEMSSRIRHKLVFLHLNLEDLKKNYTRSTTLIKRSNLSRKFHKASSQMRLLGQSVLNYVFNYTIRLVNFKNSLT